VYKTQFGGCLLLSSVCIGFCESFDSCFKKVKELMILFNCCLKRVKVSVIMFNFNEMICYAVVLRNANSNFL
jgi:hypothetical protein